MSKWTELIQKYMCKWNEKEVHFKAENTLKNTKPQNKGTSLSRSEGQATATREHRSHVWGLSTSTTTSRVRDLSAQLWLWSSSHIPQELSCQRETRKTRRLMFGKYTREGRPVPCWCLWVFDIQLVQKFMIKLCGVVNYALIYLGCLLNGMFLSQNPLQESVLVTCRGISSHQGGKDQH